jgi:hypothetical protein
LRGERFTENLTLNGNFLAHKPKRQNQAPADPIKYRPASTQLGKGVLHAYEFLDPVHSCMDVKCFFFSLCHFSLKKATQILSPWCEMSCLGKNYKPGRNHIFLPGIDFEKLYFGRKHYKQILIIKFWTHFHPKTTQSIMGNNVTF